jgi:phosphotriesterase-related protein
MEKDDLRVLCPFFTRLREQYGCHTIVEVSPCGYRYAKDIELWAELSRRTGVHIVGCTGYYVDVARPADFSSRAASQLADGMIKEITIGIEDTAVRAGIIKIAVSNMGPDDRKLCLAAALAQRATGVSITTHTCDPMTRRSVLDLLEGAGVDPERIYLGHADGNATLIEWLELAQRGCNMIPDGFWRAQPQVDWLDAARVAALPRH